MSANRTYPVTFAILCASCACASRVDAEDKKVEAVGSWGGMLKDKKLTEMAPKKGYITSNAAWKKLWEAWRPNAKLPEVDFTKYLVLVDLGGMYPVVHELKITDQGDLKVTPAARVPPGPGFGYGMSLIELKAVKTIRGQAIEAD